MLLRYLIDSPMTTLTSVTFGVFFVSFLIPLVKNERAWVRALRAWGKA